MRVRLAAAAVLTILALPAAAQAHAAPKRQLYVSLGDSYAVGYQHGTIPVPVAEVCGLTYYCSLGDIHARTRGYRVIAKLVAATLPRR